MVKVEKINFEGWENCLQISNGTLTAIVTTDFGPRIISLSISGGRNLLSCLEETKGKIGSGKTFSGYGGHRLWYSPEIEGRTNAPDNDPAEYEIFESGVAVFAAPEKKTGIIKSMEIHMSEGNSLMVRHNIQNESLFPVELAAWGITMFDRTGLLVVPHNDYDSGYMSNRSISLWPYSDMNDDRVYWGKKYITVQQTDRKNPFKFGMSVEKEWAACFVNGCAVVKKFDYDFEGLYANGDCNFESYVCGDFIEVESLTPLVTVGIGEMLSYDEEWLVFADVKAPAARDENEIEAAVKKLL